mgnify:CR=1 FL=1
MLGALFLVLALMLAGIATAAADAARHEARLVVIAFRGRGASPLAGPAGISRTEELAELARIL